MAVYSYKGRYPNAKSALNIRENGEKLTKMKTAITAKSKFNNCIEKMLEVNLFNNHKHDTHPIGCLIDE